MARQQVVEIRCDRCTRVEHRALNSVKDDGHPAFTATWKGKTISYDDLCTGCEEIINIRMETIGREISKMSPIRVKRRTLSAEAKEREQKAGSAGTPSRS